MASPLYVALGFAGRVATSPDGKKWTEREAGDHNIRSGYFGPKGIVASARGKTSLFSSDGRKWDVSANEGLPAQLINFAQHGETLVAIGGDAVTVGKADGYLATSRNGESWELASTIGDGKKAPRAAVSDGKRLVVVGDRGFKAATTDLKDWKVSEDQRSADTLINVAFGAGKFVGGGIHGLRMSSSDGLDWTRIDGGEEGEHINSMIWTGSEFVGIGFGATYRSPDGVKWSRTPNVNPPMDAAYGPAGYVGTAWRGRILHSPDAITWTEVFKLPANISKIVVGTA